MRYQQAKYSSGRERENHESCSGGLLFWGVSIVQTVYIVNRRWKISISLQSGYSNTGEIFSFERSGKKKNLWGWFFFFLHFNKVFWDFLEFCRRSVWFLFGSTPAVTRRFCSLSLSLKEWWDFRFFRRSSSRVFIFFSRCRRNIYYVSMHVNEFRGPHWVPLYLINNQDIWSQWGGGGGIITSAV